jgi:protein-tyrosine phosphatase
MAGSVSAKYAIQFGLMAIAALLAAVFGAAAWASRIVLIWVAAAFALVAVAYALGHPGLLMKREDGSQPGFAWFILWPYFLLVRLSFLVYRLSHRGKVAVAEVLPGIWFGRRLSRREMRESGVAWSALLDLAAEFPRVSSNAVTYRTLPMLDGAVPTEAQLRDAVAWIDEQAGRGNVLVHCALGHGRTGAVVVAWLLWHGHVPDVQAAIAHLRARRSTFGMSRAQVAFVEHLTTESRVDAQAAKPGEGVG